jgi:hypothetical protein
MGDELGLLECSVCYKTRCLMENITVAGILGEVRTRYSMSTFLDIHSHNNVLRTMLRQLKIEIKGNISRTRI